jgi:hypothetical protein
MANKTTHSQAKKRYAEASRYLAKNPVNETPETASNIRYSRREGHPLVTGFAVVGALGVFALAAAGAINFLKSDSAESLTKPICGISGVVAERLNDGACVVTVNSPTEVNARSSSDILLGEVLKYNLESDNKIRPGRGDNSQMIALVVSVDAVPGPNYENSVLPDVLAEKGGLTTDTFFSAMKEYVQKYDVPAEMITSGCVLEMDALMQGVRDNADKFASDALPVKEIVNPDVVFHQTDFAPFTDVPVPDKRIEVIFVHNDQPLTCPQP